MPAPQVEDFDDDFDFELPPVPSTGEGARSSSPQLTNPAQIAAFQKAMMSGDGPPGMANMMKNVSGRAEKGSDRDAKHKNWNTVYPIYFDAKRHFKQGTRRVPYSKSCACPQSLHIAKAVSRLGFEAHHEPFKVHPQDWENPGRVKVRLHSDSGDAINPKITNRRELLLAIADMIQPQCGGTPPPLLSSAKEERVTAATDPKAGVGKKGQNATSKLKSQRPLHPLILRRKALALPPIEQRLPPHSPALETGTFNQAAGGGGASQALGMLGGLGGLLGGMGLGDSDDEEEGEKPKVIETEMQRRHREEKEHMEKMMAQAKKQRKKMVRVGR